MILSKLGRFLMRSRLLKRTIYEKSDRDLTEKFHLPRPTYDLNYYLNEQNKVVISENIKSRKGIGDIEEVLRLNGELNKADETQKEQTLEELQKQLMKLPNKTHPSIMNYADPIEVKTINVKQLYNTHKPLELNDITRKLNIMRTDQLGHTCGPKSYYFMGDLAEMEEALIQYTVDILLSKGFELVSVPDILPGELLEGCGMNLNTSRTQIYQLDPEHNGPNQYLSGTAEMSLAGLVAGEVIDECEMPVKLAAVSRCFRAETSNVAEQRGIYRVHQFTKVEMFVLTTPDQSDSCLEYIRDIEEEIFTPLGIHMRVLDMPPHELGAPAYRKYDIEAWMPGRNSYGEISSCSNCTDFQSRRLSIEYHKKSGEKDFVHTLNGTACAVPRMLIALLETHQKANGKVEIPDVLRPYMNGKQYLTRSKGIPDLKLNKLKKL